MLAEQAVVLELGDLVGTVSSENLAMLEHLRQQIQRHRIQMGNRAGAVEDGRSQMDPRIVEYFGRRFETLEADIMEIIRSSVRDHEMWPWLEAVKGIGPTLAGALLAHIDIRIPTSVSGLWRYAGQGVNNTTLQRDRPTKGERLPYNAELKRICYLIETAFLRSGSPYRLEYDLKKAYYVEHRPDWTPGHSDQAAKRAMVKLFLEHLFTVWRAELDLPLLPPYAIAELKHYHVKPPWDYVPFAYSDRVIQHYEQMRQLAAIPRAELASGQESP